MALALAGLAPGQAADDKPYKVADGTKVDKVTLEGWRTWRALACERCHGPKQEGLVGPSLLESMRRLSKDEFKQAMLKGRPEKACRTSTAARWSPRTSTASMPTSGRSDGAIQPGRLS